MRYCITLALLSAVIVVTGFEPARGQYVNPAWPGPGVRAAGDLLAGTYVNQETGGICTVNVLGRGYIFTDDAGIRIPFVVAGYGTGELRSVRTNANIPDILVTVSYDRAGRTVLRFDSPGMATGYWVSGV